jgi:trimeric autotransporter adhesin
MKASLALSTGAAVALATLSVSLALPAAENPPRPGTILTVAGTGKPAFSGDGGAATQAALYNPFGIAFDAAGDLFIGGGNSDAGIGNRVRRIDPAGIITTVAGSGKFAFSGDGGPATSAGMAPLDVTVDSAGTLYIADYNNNRVRKMDAGGIITTVAGGGNPADGLGDGGPATGAGLNGPFGLATDMAGNLFIADTGHNRVRMVNPAGTITTVAGTGQAGFAGDGGPATAAQLSGPFHLAVDKTGHLFITDLGNLRVRMVSPDGTIGTVAGGGNPAVGLGDGGLATAARLDHPEQLALDGAGNLFIADNGSRRIRRVGMSEAGAGLISTVAGTGAAGFSGDGGPATQALLSGPFGLAIDKAGNLYFSDTGRLVNGSFETVGNQRIREVVGVGVPR